MGGSDTHPAVVRRGKRAALGLALVPEMLFRAAWAVEGHLGCLVEVFVDAEVRLPALLIVRAPLTLALRGNITAGNADTVLIRKVTVNGNVSLAGGGGEIPWSIKGNTIGGNLTINQVTADWLGVQFNAIGRNAVLTNITALDPGDPGRTVAVVENTVQNNLICMGLAPGVSPGFIPGEVNHVGHQALGQCAAISEKL